MDKFHGYTRFVCFIALIFGLVACGENEPFDHTPQAATSLGNNGGTAGTSGSAGAGGSAGSTGTGGSSGTGGTAGTGGSAGTGGTSGSGGSAGAGGSAGGSNVCVPNTSAPCSISPTCIGDAFCKPDGSGYLECQKRTEICGNGLDDDCNGQTDESCGSLGCTTGQPGRTVRYRFTMPDSIVAKELVIFDRGDDANGIPVARPVACGGTEFDENYSWGTSYDCGCAQTCLILNSSTLDCIVHRPAGATLRINPWMVFTQNNTPMWSCVNDLFVVIGTPEFWVDGLPVTPDKEVWPGEQIGDPPACRFVLKI